MIFINDTWSASTSLLKVRSLHIKDDDAFRHLTTPESHRCLRKFWKCLAFNKYAQRCLPRPIYIRLTINLRIFHENPRRSGTRSQIEGVPDMMHISTAFLGDVAINYKITSIILDRFLLRTAFECVTNKQKTPPLHQSLACLWLPAVDLTTPPSDGQSTRR